MLEENNFDTQINDTQPSQPVYQGDSYQYGFMNEAYREKKDIRRIALTVGIPCVCLSLITLVWSVVYIYVTTKIIGMSYSDAVSLTEDAAVQQILQIILSILMFLLPFPIAARCAGYRIDSLIKTNKPQKNTALPFFFIGVGFCCFSNIAVNYCSAFFEGMGIEYDVNYGDNPKGMLGFLLSFIATAIVPALVEEFACRGIVLGLLRKYGDGFAIITSSIVFGVMHGNFDQIPFAVMVGLILGYIYVKSDSIWISVAVHCANNAISVIFTYLDGNLSINIQNLIYLVYLIFGLLAAVFGIYMLCRSAILKTQKRGVVATDDYRSKLLFEGFVLDNKNNNLSTTKQKYTYFFTSWVIILFLIFNFVESLTYFVI